MPNAVPGFVYTDRVKPAVSITNPTAGGTTTGTINVTATATDNDQIAGVQFYLDGSPLGAEDTVAPYSVSLNTAGLTTGAHSVYAIARDRVGNTTQATTVNFTNADQHAPTVTITSPGNGSTQTGTITLTATASDDVGVSHVDYYVDGSFVGNGSGGSWSLAYNTRVLGDGVHTIQAYAYDAAGNQSPVSTITITTVNNIAFLGAGAGLASASPGAIPAGSLVIAAIYMAGGSPASFGDNGGNSYTALTSGGVAGDPADGVGGNLWMYWSVTGAPMSSFSVDGAGNQVCVAVSAYARANGGEHFATGVSDWGTWAGPTIADLVAREVQIAVTVAGYDGNASSSPNPSVGVFGPFSKRAGVTDTSNSWAELAIMDWISSTGGTSGPSGNTNNAADVYGAVAGFVGT